MSKDKLALATQNKYKLAEVTPLFKKFAVPFEAVDHPKFEIRSENVEEIARVAALHAAKSLGRPVIVDDTALFIDALNGFPSTYAAFILRTIGRSGILRLMNGIDKRDARFITAVGYSDGLRTYTFKGVMEGTIATTERGIGGFGYDPIFIPTGFSRTYAELSFDEKVAISHRTQAFASFLKWYVSSLNTS